MGSYVGKSNGLAEAAVVPGGPTGPVEILLVNPNATSVAGTLYLRNQLDEYPLPKFTVDGSVGTQVRLPPLTDVQSVYLKLDSDPAAQLTIWSTW